MTKQILFSLLSLLFIFVSISNALESQDNGLVSNDQVPGEADAVLSEVNSLPEEVASSRLARAAASEARKKSRQRKKATKKSEKGNKKKKGSLKKRKNKKASKKKKKSMKNKSKKKKKSMKNKSKKKKIKSQKQKKIKSLKRKKNKQESGDGNTITIVCPECPKTLICTKSKNRNGKKLTKKEKKMWKKTRKIEKKIEKINNKYQKQMARNGDAEDDDDKLCTPCCPPTPAPTSAPTPAPPTGPTTVPPPPPPPNNCTPCVMHTASVMDVWRFQVTNFEKQKKRVENQNNIATNKASANKTSAFTDLANHLTGLSCAMNMAEIDDTKTKLMECTAQITAACNLTRINQTFVDECTTKTTDFVTEATKCKDGARKGKSDDCPCFKALFATLSDVKKCKIAETATIADEFKACKAAFSSCKKLEDSVGPLVIKGMCGTATTTGAPRLRRKWMFDKLRV